MRKHSKRKGYQRKFRGVELQTIFICLNSRQAIRIRSY